MALQDVSKMITDFQRLCHFAEWFTRVFRDPLSKALQQVFAKDLPEGEEPPDVLGMVDSLVRSLRSGLTAVTGSETELLSAIKKEEFLRNLVETLTKELRQLFDRARSLCRASFGAKKADEAGFPSRVADGYLPLLRQTDVVTFNLTGSDFDLGENQVPGSNHDATTIVNTYEPTAAALRKALDDITSQKALIQGKQVSKDELFASFKTTYGIFVAIVRGCFRLAGLPELAKRLTLTQRRRSSSGEEPEPDPDLPEDFSDVPEIPDEFADLVRLDGSDDAKESEGGEPPEGEPEEDAETE